MFKRYRKWMHDWEYRLTTRDTNRVVRPLEWGLDWAAQWPLVNGNMPTSETQAENFLQEINHKIVANSDKFYSYLTPTDFRLEGFIRTTNNRGSSAGQVLRFTSPVQTPYPENNVVTARWFPARGRRAVVVMPQWNADAESHNSLCKIFNFLGIAALRLSMPYHDVRKPSELDRADYACSSNIARTIDATRQAVTDTRSCFDWLQSQGYSQLGIMGTSIGSCYAFITAAHESRISVAAYNHASTYFGDVVWTGQSTRHIRAGIEGKLTRDQLRELFLSISPMSYFDQYERVPKKSLVIYATHDLTFLPEFSRQVVAEFQRRKVDCQISILPCGHYTTGEMPYKFLDAWYIARFLNSAL